jgi:hypothetical protein
MKFIGQARMDAEELATEDAPAANEGHADLGGAMLETFG